jgi:hypothetical protein
MLTPMSRRRPGRLWTKEEVSHERGRSGVALSMAIAVDAWTARSIDPPFGLECECAMRFCGQACRGCPGRRGYDSTPEFARKSSVHAGGASAEIDGRHRCRLLATLSRRGYSRTCVPHHVEQHILVEGIGRGRRFQSYLVCGLRPHLPCCREHRRDFLDRVKARVVTGLLAGEWCLVQLPLLMTCVMLERSRCGYRSV